MSAVILRKERTQAYLRMEAIPDVTTGVNALSELVRLISIEALASGKDAQLHGIFVRATAEWRQLYPNEHIVEQRSFLWNVVDIAPVYDQKCWKKQELNFDIPLLVFLVVKTGQWHFHKAKTLLLGSACEQRYKQRVFRMELDHFFLLKNIRSGLTFREIREFFDAEIEIYHRLHNLPKPEIVRYFSGIGTKPNISWWETKPSHGANLRVMEDNVMLATNLLYKYQDGFMCYGEVVVTNEGSGATLLLDRLVDGNSNLQLECTLKVDPTPQSNEMEWEDVAVEKLDCEGKNLQEQSKSLNCYS